MFKTKKKKLGPFVGSERRPRAGREEKVTRGLGAGNFGCHHRGRIKQAGNLEPSVKHLDGGFLKVPAAVSTSCWAGPAAWRRWRTAGCPAASTQPRARWRLWRPDAAGPPPLWRPADQSGEASRRFTKMDFKLRNAFPLHLLILAFFLFFRFLYF